MHLRPQSDIRYSTAILTAIKSLRVRACIHNAPNVVRQDYCRAGMPSVRMNRANHETCEDYCRRCE